MTSHIRKPPRPVSYVKVRVTPPPVPVGFATAPFGFGDMVIKVDINLLGRTGCCDGIEHLVI